MPKSIRPKAMSVEGLIWNDGRYLTIVRGADVGHAAGMLAFSGGGVEMRAERVENVLEANVRREVMEETGVKIQDEMHYLESTGFIDDEAIPSLHVTFLCLYASGEAHIASQREVDAVEWLTADEITKHPKAPAWIVRGIELAEAKRLELGW